MIVGIDNGISGGVAILRNSGEFTLSFPMPIQRSRRGNEIDVSELSKKLYRDLCFRDGTATFVIEEPGGSKSAKAAASMAGSFHAIRALLEIRLVRWHRVTPQEWQRVMLPGAKGDTKPRALAKARQLWPNEKFLASERCKKAHDGMIDAALIAEYARIRNL